MTNDELVGLFYQAKPDTFCCWACLVNSFGKTNDRCSRINVKTVNDPKAFAAARQFEVDHADEHGNTVH